MKQGRKQLLEFGPLLVFFLVNWKAGIFWATGIFMVTILAVLLYTFVTTGKVAKVPLATAILVGVFGGLTLYLHDETFIKVKLTLVNSIFAVLLLGGVALSAAFHQGRDGRGGQASRTRHGARSACAGAFSSPCLRCSTKLSGAISQPTSG